MSTLRTQLAVVKGRAVDASKEAPIEHPYRTAAYHLLTRGDFVAGDIRYRINRTIGRGGWSGHRDGPLNHHVNGGASYSGPFLALVLEWTLFPLGPVRVWTREFTGYNGTTDNIVFYANADCPLGCGRVQRTCEDQGYGPDGVTRYGWIQEIRHSHWTGMSKIKLITSDVTDNP